MQLPLPHSACTVDDVGHFFVLVLMNSFYSTGKDIVICTDVKYVFILLNWILLLCYRNNQDYVFITYLLINCFEFSSNFFIFTSQMIHLMIFIFFIFGLSHFFLLFNSTLSFTLLSIFHISSDIYLHFYSMITFKFC